MKKKKMTIDQSYPVSVGMLVAAMVLAGSSVVVGKIMIVSLPVFLGTFLTLVVALLCILPLMRGRAAEIRSLSAREWRYLFLQGLCGIVLFRVFTLYGLKMTGAVQAGIVTGSTPAVLAVLSWLLLGEKLGRRSRLAILCAVSGCVLINVLDGEGRVGGMVLGSVLVGLAVVCEALFTIFRKRVAGTVSALTNTAVLLFCSLVLLAVPAFWELRGLERLPDLGGWLAIGYYGVFATVAAYLLWTSAVARVDGATAGTATAAMPASSVILAAVILHEPLRWQYLIGCLLIILGIVIAAIRPKGMELQSNPFPAK